MCLHIFTLVLGFSSGAHLEVKSLDCMMLLFSLFEETPCCFPWWLHQFTTPTVPRGSLSLSLSTLVSCLLDIAILTGVGGVSLCFVLLICIFLMVSDAELISCICWPCVVFFRKKNAFSITLLILKSVCVSF